MVNLPLINDNIIKPLMYDSHFFPAEERSDISDMEELRERFLSAGDVKIVRDIPR
jgi:spore germination protein KA